MTATALVALIARLVLAGVFGVAGVAKLRDRAGTRTALAAFGAPTGSLRTLVIALPAMELATAALLLPAATALAGSILALALLLVFTAAVARTLARGETPACHCFGQLHSRPTGPWTLIRNGVLIVVAGIAVAGSAGSSVPSAVGWLGRLDATQALLLGAVLVTATAVAGCGAVLISVMRSYGRVLVRLDRIEGSLAELGIDLKDGPASVMAGLDPGSETPWFLATRLDGQAVSQDQIIVDGRPTVLVFSSPYCGPCRELVPELSSWRTEHTELEIVVVSDGTRDEILAEFGGRLPPAAVILDGRHELYGAFQANGTPSAVLITRDGRIGSWVASGRDEIIELVARAAEPMPEPSLAIGAPVPPLEVTLLDGGTASLSSLIDRPTVALFWNPHCGYCQAMRDDLQAWEATKGSDAPSIIIISSASPDDTRTDGFRSTAVIDDAFAVGEALGAGGTPMAVALGADATIASQLVAGAEEVLELLRGAARPTI